MLASKYMLKMNALYRRPLHAPQHVYYPAPPHPRTTYYTTTILDSQQLQQRVLAFYAHKDLVPADVSVMADRRITCIPLADAYHLTSIISMPAVVFLNSYCDLSTHAEWHEVLYIRQQQGLSFMQDKKRRA